ncbi:MAG: ribosome recycling factor [Acholeplasmatales bacterium]|jgi:ribosome recycling factor|nr:ribosome recycling factor [Acholeplasmatales bacterium]
MNELAEDLLLETQERMKKSIQAIVKDFNNIRTGRANPALLDHLMIDYYGVSTPIKQISAINVLEGTQLYIKPFDRSVLKNIEKAIYSSDLGLTPNNDGIGIRLILPVLTQERRKTLVKEVEKLEEGGKVALRNIRRDANEEIKILELTEDDEKGYLQDIQELTNKYIAELEIEKDKKSEELLMR